MSSSLGLCIEKNLIKYAKVTRNHDEVTVDAFGIKFYENVKEAIGQIISETFSENIPISVNISDEVYNYFDVPSDLSKTELKEEIEDDFDEYCEKKKIFSEDYETRYSMYKKDGKDTCKVMHVSIPKSSVNSVLRNVEGGKVSTITPLGISMANIILASPKEKVLIVNLDDETIITSIINQEINDVKKIKAGPTNILRKIAGKENSYSKAYEICKNSTIYTMEGKETLDEGNEYMEVIIPALEKVVTDVQKYITKSKTKYNKIYITGTLSVVNNIDLYFQEFFPDEKCEILKPYFIKDIAKINIKDYIEVNAALSLAMQGLGYGIQEMNFQKQTFSMPITDILKKEPSKENVNKSKSTNNKKNNKVHLDFDMSGKLDKTERWMLRGVGLLLAIIIVYSIFSIYLNSRINNKLQEVQDSIAYTDSQIALADSDINEINTKAADYNQMVNNLNHVNSQLETNMDSKGRIPNLLTNIMSIIPENVQITEIDNTQENDGKHVIIKAQSEYYDELGYFKLKLKDEGILTNVVSSQETSDKFVEMVIEGDLL